MVAFIGMIQVSGSTSCLLGPIGVYHCANRPCTAARSSIGRIWDPSSAEKWQGCGCSGIATHEPVHLPAR